MADMASSPATPHLEDNPAVHRLRRPSQAHNGSLDRPYGPILGRRRQDHIGMAASHLQRHPVRTKFR